MRLTKRGKKRLIIVGSVAGVLAVGGSLAVALRGVYRGRLAERARGEGMTAYHGGDYEGAIVPLSAAVGYRKDDLDAVLAFADARSRIVQVNGDHLRSSVMLYNAALKIDPVNQQALESLLDLYQQLGYRAETVEIANRLLAVAPDDVPALSARAMCAYAEEHHDEVRELAERLHELEPDVLTWPALVIRAMSAQGNTEEAILERAAGWAEAFAGDGRYVLLHAQVMYDQGRFDASRARAVEAAERGAEDLQVLEAMLTMLDTLELPDEADALLTRARTVTDAEGRADWVTEASVRRHWRRGRLRAAAEELAALPDLDHRLLRWNALVQAELGRTDACRATLKTLETRAEALDRDARDAERAWVAAITRRLDGDGGNAAAMIAACRQAVQAEPGDPVLQTFLGDAYRDVGEMELAVAAYRHAADLDPYWSTPQIARVETLLILDRPELAFRAMQALVRRTPELRVQDYVLLARAWLQLGGGSRSVPAGTDAQARPFTVVALLATLHAEWPGHPEIAGLLVDAYMQSDQRDDAVTLIEDALNASDPSGVVLARLAESSRKWGLGYATSLLERATQLDENAPTLLAAQARACLTDGRPESGLALLAEAEQGAEDRAFFRSATRSLRLALERAQCGDDRDAVRTWLEATDEPRAVATLVLSEAKSWDDRTLVERAVEILSAELGADSPRVKLYRAGVVARYRADESDALAEATSLTNEALQETPDSHYGLVLMSALLLEGDQPLPHQAIRHLERAIQLYPNDVTLYPRLIALLQAEGDYDTASEYLRSLARRNVSEFTAQSVGRAELELLRRQGDYEGAIERMLATLGPNATTDEQLELGALFHQIGRHAEAEATYRRLLVTDGATRQAEGPLAELLAVTGRYDEGRALLAQRADRDRRAADYAALGTFALRHGDRGTAQESLGAAVARAPDDAEDWATIAELRLALGDIAGAHEAIDAGFAIDPLHAALRQALMTAGFASNGRAHAETIQRLEAAGETNPAVLETLRLAQRLNPDAGMPSATDLEDARALVEAHPLFGPGWRIAAALHARAGDIEGAVRLARRGSARVPTVSDLPAFGARLLLDANRFNEALELARMMRERTAANPMDADLLVARIELRLDRAEAARRLLERHADRLVAEHERHPDRLTLWMETLLRAGDFDAARALAEPRLGSDAAIRSAWISLAGDLGADVGVRMIAMAMRAAPVDDTMRLQMATAWSSIASVYGHEDGWRHASALMDEIRDRERFGEAIAMLRATVAAGRGANTEAERHYREVLARVPDHPVALNNLALVLTRDPTRCGEAVELARVALVGLPDQPAILDTLARALVCSGQPDEAESIVRRALVKRGPTAALRLTLARALHVQGRDDEARSSLDIARRELTLQRRPDPALDREIRRLSETLNDEIARAAAGVAPADARSGVGE